MNEIIYHILFLCICFFQVFFMLLQWMLFKRKEYMYYILFLLTTAVFVLLRVNSVNQILPFQLNAVANELLDQPLIIFAIWMYIRFSYYFLNLKQLQPNVYIAAKRLEIGFATLVTVRCILIPFQLSYYNAAFLHLVACVLLNILSISVIVRLLKQKNLLNNFLVSGSLCITIGGLIGPIIATFMPDMGNGNLSVYYGLEVGVLVAVLLLNTGFLLKNRILNQQVIKAQAALIKQYENDKAQF